MPTFIFEASTRFMTYISLYGDFVENFGPSNSIEFALPQPPGQIIGLTVTSVTELTVSLSWIAPGDDWYFGQGEEEGA